MSHCCALPASGTNGATCCPVSGTQGKPVEVQTVKALLTEAALRRLADSTHRFCPEPTCGVVYFDETGQTFSKADVRVPVWQKEPFGARMVCYCFAKARRTSVPRSTRPARLRPSSARAHRGAPLRVRSEESARHLLPG